MPGTTPNFGIRYPCAGETINPTVFQNFADDVESAMLTVETAGDRALLRPRGARRTAVTGTSTAVGVTTAMSFTTDDFLQGAGLSTSAGGFTSALGGIFVVTAEFSGITTVTSVTSWAGEIQMGGSVVYRRKVGLSGAQTVAHEINISGVVRCPAATALTAHWVWTGSGGPMFVYSRFSVQQIADL